MESDKFKKKKEGGGRKEEVWSLRGNSVVGAAVPVTLRKCRGGAPQAPNKSPPYHLSSTICLLPAVPLVRRRTRWHEICYNFDGPRGIRRFS